MAVSFFDGRPRSIAEWIDSAARLEDTFGIDQSMRMIAITIRMEARKALEAASDAP